MFKIKRELFVYINEAKSIGECICDVIATIDDKWIVVFTEMIKNPGPSITNAMDCIIPQFCRANGLVPSEVEFFERYQDRPNDLHAIRYAVDKTIFWEGVPDDRVLPILEALK
jgi:hypothetical protein